MSDDYRDGPDVTNYLPTSIKNLRSCIGCGLLQTEEWWKETRCPNCKLGTRVNKYTSASFTGMLAVFDPGESWCAQWHRYDMNVPGIYALYNEGEVTADIISKLEGRHRPLPEWVERAKTQLQAADKS